MQYSFSTFRTELKKVEEYLVKEYNQLNIGRASPMVLEGVSVESYGSRMPLKNVANVSIEDPKTLRIAPWDKSQVKEIEKAIIASNLGLSVATDEAGIRVIFPQLTTETRQALVKVLKEKLE
jgi:ribosome recycling factor